MGTKYYGASLTFYERYTKALDDTQREKLESESVDQNSVGNDADAVAEFMNAKVGSILNV